MRTENTPRSPFHLAAEPSLSCEEFHQVLLESGLGATRPMDDLPRLGSMLAAADLVITARWESPGGRLVGVARCITDFSWCCYVSEIAVSHSVQGQGVGKALLGRIRDDLGKKVSIVLASMPDAVGFYESIGMPRMPDTFCYRREI
jgi:ribosomal protein S18 acetylase RimI-like enzyme